MLPFEGMCPRMCLLKAAYFLGGLSGEVEYTGVRYVVSPYKLNLIATPLFIKPGLPFFVKVS